MLRISISKTGSPTRSSSFDKREISLGRTASNDLVIAEPGVSGNHARILYLDGELTLIDLDSTNGTFVNGQRIQGPHIVQPSDEIYICAHRLTFELESGSGRADSAAPSFPPPIGNMSPIPEPIQGPQTVFPTAPPTLETPQVSSSSHSAPPLFPPLLEGPQLPSPADPAPFPELPDPVADSLPAFPEGLPPPEQPPALSAFPVALGVDADAPPLFPQLEERPAPLDDVRGPKLPHAGPTPTPVAAHEPQTPFLEPAGNVDRSGASVCDTAFTEVLRELSEGGRLPPAEPSTRAHARRRLQELLSQSSSGPGFDVQSWPDRMLEELFGPERLSALCATPGEFMLRGPLSATPPFSCARAVEVAVRRATGHPFSPEHPVVTARTPDGLEIHAVHDALIPEGPFVALRRHAPASASMDLADLVRARMMGPGAASLMQAVVQVGFCVMICASPGTDPTPLMMALARSTPAGARQVWVGSSSGVTTALPSGSIAITRGVLPGGRLDPDPSVVRAATGFAPERLWYLDVSGPEAPGLLAAYGSPRIGGAFSLRAHSTEAGLDRMAGLSCPSPGGSLAMQRCVVAQTVDLALGIGRRADGTQIITQIAEPQVSSSGAVQLLELVRFDDHAGDWVRSGSQPTFLALLQQRGLSVDLNRA